MIYIRLREIREQRGLTQKELAEVTGLTIPKISRIENNKNNYIFNPHLEQLVRTLGITFNDILEIK